MDMKLYSFYRLIQVCKNQNRCYIYIYSYLFQISILKLTYVVIQFLLFFYSLTLQDIQTKEKYT